MIDNVQSDLSELQRLTFFFPKNIFSNKMDSFHITNIQYSKRNIKLKVTLRARVCWKCLSSVVCVKIYIYYSNAKMIFKMHPNSAYSCAILNILMKLLHPNQCIVTANYTTIYVFHCWASITCLLLCWVTRKILHFKHKNNFIFSTDK